MKQPTDQLNRIKALDTTKSFIVQAPAGSGKTTVLVKRYLKLLAQVDSPEEIIAITFTRKAANEMIERVLSALKLVEQAKAKEVDLELLDCAALAHKRNLQKDWLLLENPARIRIQTIDAFAYQLVQQMPWSAGFGAAPAGVSDDVGELYQKAARKALLDALYQDEYKASAQCFLVALENNFDRACQLLVSMLSKRDQWQQVLLTNLSDDDAKLKLEFAWQQVIESALNNCRQKLTASIQSNLLECGRYAAENLSQKQSDSPVVSLRDQIEFPQPVMDELAIWQALASLVLTDKGALRKRVDARHGFPTAKAGGDEAKKQKFAELLAEIEHLAIVQDFAAVLSLPEIEYTDQQWQLVKALVDVLKLAMAQLSLIFQQQSSCDHTEIASRANLALGDNEGPSELALRLDYKIQHILVDEFQDTSFTQLRMLQQLTAGWQGQDGRTIFLVGDPMQSIYRFRQADVSIFLDVVANGLGEIDVQSLSLTDNFRSLSPLVEWVNETFGRVFPAKDNPQSAAVKYSKANAFKDDLNANSKVAFHLLDRDSEAKQLVNLIHQLRKEDQSIDSIAVLVRSRSHLTEIVGGLNEAGLAYQGLKLKSLAQMSCVQDIHAITKALSHLADRLSWLAVLRAPWSGLDLIALTQIAEHDQQKTVWQTLTDDGLELPATVQARIDKVLKVFSAVLNTKAHDSLHDRVRFVWQQLGGADTVAAEDLPNVSSYLNLLREQEKAGQIASFEQFESKLNDLWASADGVSNKIQLMTIHAAKGLEFDAVILPGLFKKSRPDEASLLAWQEYAIEGQRQLLLAPIKLFNQQSRRYDFIRSLEKKMQLEENKRLFYVACTRAVKQLHLSVAEQADSSSLQALIAQQASLAVDQSPKSEEPEPISQNDEEQQWQYKRLAADHCLIKSPEPVLSKNPKAKTQPIIEYQWAGVMAIHLGTLIHEIICQYACHGEVAINNRTNLWQARLLALGIEAKQIPLCIKRIRRVTDYLQADSTAAWIFSSEHKEVQNEWRLTSQLEDKLETYVIDRTFIDKDGVRWIIDYKTSSHEGGDLEAFLNSEQTRYAGQLQQYAKLLRQQEQRPIKLGLYFPLLKAWRDWEYAG